MKGCANSWGSYRPRQPGSPCPCRDLSCLPSFSSCCTTPTPITAPSSLSLYVLLSSRKGVLAFDAPPLGLGLVPTPMRGSVKVGFSSPAHPATAQSLTLYAPGKGCPQSPSKVRHAILSPQGACTSCLSGQGGRKAASPMSS